jgi:aryl-alcohol dehydrogenase-like predicted oxidoreductase
LQHKPYGAARTPLSVLGLGAGQIGDTTQDEAAVARLLNTALDLGITLIDTARGYGLSEERIGRHIAHRRAEYTLSTKVGYGIPGHDDWTAGCISAGVDAALQRLRTDRLDIVHLHSCPLGTLTQGDVVQALQRAHQAGKVGTVAYSGENDALDWAAGSGHFGGLECSVNLYDQASLGGALAVAQTRGLGVIAKRPLGNAPWRYAERPVGQYCETYWQRMQVMALGDFGLPWDELALRFAAFEPKVTCAIVGTSSVEHLQHNAAIVARGPLPAQTVAAIQARFAAVGSGWQGEI